LNRPEDIKKLRIHAKNIVDWGLGSRLEKIGTALDVILTKERKRRQAELKRRGELYRRRLLSTQQSSWLDVIV